MIPQAPLIRANETLSVSSCRVRRARRAERRANCEFPLLARCACEHEIGHICARDQEHHTYSAKQDQERHAYRTSNIECCGRSIPHTPVSILVGNSSSMRAARRRISSLVLIHVEFHAQSPDDAERVVTAALRSIRRQRGRHLRRAGDSICVRPISRKGCRNDADDLVADTVQSDCATP